jgi:hypothetical protein
MKPMAEKVLTRFVADHAPITHGASAGLWARTVKTGRASTEGATLPNCAVKGGWCRNSPSLR